MTGCLGRFSHVKVPRISRRLTNKSATDLIISFLRTQRARMVLIFRDLRSSTPRMSNPHHLHSTQTGDPCPSAVPFSCSGLASRRHPSRTPSFPSIIGGLIPHDVRQRLESRAAVEYCKKVTLYLVCFHHVSTFCTTLPGCRYVCEFTRACVFAHHEVPAGLGHIPPSSGIETKTASVGTDSEL